MKRLLYLPLFSLLIHGAFASDFEEPKLTTDIHLRNFTKNDRLKIDEASVILTTVINSEEFKKRVLNFTFNGQLRFHDNQGKSNQEIYDHIMTGAEVLMPNTTGVMNFDLSLYRSRNPFSQVRGYTRPSTSRIFIAKKFFRRTSWRAKDVAANMAHEWVHKMGYKHDFKSNRDRPFSVPYGVGYIIEDIAEEMGY